MTRLEALDRLPQEFPVRLLGFRGERGEAQGTDGGAGPEWMVEAVIDVRPSSGKRFFLVPEGREVTAIEIAPRAWRGRGFILQSREAASCRAGPIEGERAYRAYVVEDPCPLAAPEVLPGPGRLLLPRVPGAPPREWVLPARWSN
jgi:hypothetical protein